MASWCPREHESSGRKFIHDIEVVRSIVLAYADGEIELEVDHKTRDDQKRYAPSCVVGDVHGRDHAHPYTATEITEFLGWPKNNAGQRSSSNERVMVALNALEMNEQGHLDLEQFCGPVTAQNPLIDSAIRFTWSSPETRLRAVLGPSSHNSRPMS